MPAPRFPVHHLSRARLRRVKERLSLRNRLVLSHVMVLLLALAAMAAISALIEVWLGFDDVEGDVVLQVGLLFGGAAAFPASVALSRFLLRPLDRVRAATRRLAEGHYDDVLELPSEPGLAALVQDVNTLAAALADTERRRARLISEVAHEMRTPITILRGQIEGIADGIFTPDEAMFASSPTTSTGCSAWPATSPACPGRRRAPSIFAASPPTWPCWFGAQPSDCAPSTTTRW